MLETGAPLLATQIGGEWVFWQTGENDLFVVLMNLRRTMLTLGAGWLVILIAAVLAAFYRRRRVRTP